MSNKIFFSYARKDGEDFADKLIERLRKDLPNIEIMKDRDFMEGGKDYWESIVKNIEMANFIILIMTDFSLKSPNCREEWYWARHHGKCVIPVKQKKDDLDFKLLPLCLQRAHCYNVDNDNEWKTFVKYLKKPCVPLRVPYVQNSLKDHYVERSKELKSLCNFLIDNEKVNPIRNIVILWGFGGYGKTVQAQQFCDKEKTKNAYCDGILYIELGQNPNIEGELFRIYRRLTGKNRRFLNEGEIEQYLADKMDELNRNYLLVIDDVWNLEQLEPFLRIGRNCSMLITTRQLDIATGIKSHIIKIEELDTEEAAKILWARLAEKPVNIKPFERLATKLGKMPLLLRLAGDILNKQSYRYSLEEALKRLNKDFDLIGVTAFDKSKKEECNLAVKRSIDISIKYLKEEEGQDTKPFMQLGVFSKETKIPIPIVSALWQKDKYNTEKLCEKFHDFSLIKFSPGNEKIYGSVSIPTVLHEYLIEMLKVLDDGVKLNSRIADALLSQHKEDEYKIKYLLEHLIEAHRWGNIREILSDVEFFKKRQTPAEQLNLKRNFKHLFEIDVPLEELLVILNEVLNTITNQLEDMEDMIDWLDTFAGWLTELGKSENVEQATKIKEIARTFDKECGRISIELINKYREKSDFSWAMRYAELATWVYQRSGYHKECIDSCKLAEDLCEYLTNDPVHRQILKTEFIRMRIRALRFLINEQKEEIKKQMYEEEVKNAYEALGKEFSLGGHNMWMPDIYQWRILEDYDDEKLLPTRSMSGQGNGARFKAQVVSNKHDAVSAMYIIQYLEGKGGEVDWIYSKNFEIEDFAPENIKFTILIGGPKAPGISKVANIFYKTDKDKFYRLYTPTKFESTVIETREGNTFCYMVGGPSKANTLEGTVHELRNKLEERIIEISK